MTLIVVEGEPVTMPTGSGWTMDRRAMLGTLVGTALSATVAGCTGDGDGGTDGGENTDAPRRTPGAPPDDAVSAPTGEGAITLAVSQFDAGTDAWSSVEELTVDVGHVVLERRDGPPVAIAVDQSLDLAAVTSDSGMTLVENLAVPAATYTKAAYYMPVQRLTLADGGSPSGPLPSSNPVTRELEVADDYLTVASGSSRRLTLEINVQQRGEGWRFATGITYY